MATLHRSHLLMALALLAALLAIPMSAAAERYYLINDGNRWQSSEGKPIQGLARSPGTICRDGGACYGLIFAQWGGWNPAEKLPRATFDQHQVELDPINGQRLYRAAQRGYWQVMNQER